MRTIPIVSRRQLPETPTCPVFEFTGATSVTDVDPPVIAFHECDTDSTNSDCPAWGNLSLTPGMISVLNVIWTCDLKQVAQ